jgi:hypothetical protein
MKRHNGKVRRNANRVILEALNRLGIKYTNMNMRQGAEAVAKGYSLPLVFGEDWKVRFAQQVAAARGVAVLLQRRAPTPRNKKAAKPSGAAKERTIKAFYDSWEWKRLSYDVKLERGRKCECCGASAPAVRIHTDHVKPIRHHWELRLDRANLQVLCEDCNMGKGSRDETDFREDFRIPELDRAADPRAVLSGPMPADGIVIWN